MTTAAPYQVAAMRQRARAMQPTGPSLLRRFVRWHVRRARLQQDAEIAQFIERCGGVLTDDVEREIGRRYGRHAG